MAMESNATNVCTRVSLVMDDWRHVSWRSKRVRAVSCLSSAQKDKSLWLLSPTKPLQWPP